MTELPVTDRTRIRREPLRAVTDRDRLYEIVDEAKICHIGFTDKGSSYVVPTLIWRIDNHIYIHGSRGSRMLKALTRQQEVCVTVTLLDGLVMARSAFLHSANYRSVMILGKFTQLTAPTEKADALKYFMNQLSPGRWEQLREMNSQELTATDVLTMPISEASIKIRSGGPNDPEKDLSIPVWAGEIPIRQVYGPNIPADNLADGIEPENFSASLNMPWTHS